MARCRSLVPAAHGDGILAREIFEKAALVASLLGPVQEVFTQAPRAEPPSTTLVTFKHAGRARYSALEVTIVPAVTHASRDDSIELTGSAGVAWLRGGPGRAREPALEIHRGDRLHREAAEACWQDAVDGCVAGFAASLRSGSQPCLAPALHAAAVTVAALASARDGQRHVTNGGPA
jgi:predicted dehydrogenase